VKPGPASLVGGARNGIRPPESMLTRQVVGTRPPRESKLPWRAETFRREAKSAPEQRYVPIPRRPSNDLPRPEFGAETGAERPRSPLPPRFEDRRRATEPAVTGNVSRERAGTGQAEPKAPRTVPFGSPMTREAAPPRVAPAESQQRADLPGKPANRVYRMKDEDEKKAKRQRSEQKPDSFNDPRQGRKRE